MGSQPTNTQNENSKYLVSPEEAQKLMSGTEMCNVIATNQITPPDFQSSQLDVMVAEIKQAYKVKDGVVVAEKGDSINPKGAFRKDEKGVRTVDVTGRTKEATQVEKNETLQGSEDRRNLQEAAERKYEENVQTEAENNPTSLGNGLGNGDSSEGR